MELTQAVQGIDWKVRYQEMINSLNIGFLVCDMQFVILDFNDKYLEMTGYKDFQLRGRHVETLYTKAEFEKLKATLLHHRVKDQYQYESRLFAADGKGIPVLTSSHIVRNSAGQAESVNVLLSDIRDLKEAHKKLEQANQTLWRNQIALKREKGMLETILFGIGDCVTIFDSRGRYILGKPQGAGIRGPGQEPLMPLTPGYQQELTLEVGGRTRCFQGKIEAVRYETGEIYAYAEILKDVTSLVELRQRERELNNIRREVKTRAIGQQHGRLQPGHRKRVRPYHPLHRGGIRCSGVWRNRGGQGAGRAGNPCQKPAQGQTLYRGQLRGPARIPFGIGAFRPCQRGFHRGHIQPSRALPRGRGRHHFSG